MSHASIEREKVWQRRQTVDSLNGCLKLPTAGGGTHFERSNFGFPLFPLLARLPVDDILHQSEVKPTGFHEFQLVPIGVDSVHQSGNQANATAQSYCAARLPHPKAHEVMRPKMEGCWVCGAGCGKGSHPYYSVRNPALVDRLEGAIKGKKCNFQTDSCHGDPFLGTFWATQACFAFEGYSLGCLEWLPPGHKEPASSILFTHPSLHKPPIGSG